jgi:hypothetical protein
VLIATSACSLTRSGTAVYLISVVIIIDPAATARRIDFFARMPFLDRRTGRSMELAAHGLAALMRFTG